MTATARADVPRVLIIQFTEEGQDEIPVDNYLAQEIDNDGKASAITWGMADPKFREAVMDGKLLNVPDKPSLNAAINTARQLAAEYVISVKATRKESIVKGVIRLYQNRREVFKAEKNLTIQVGSATSDGDLARSLARTFVALLDQGPWKNLNAKPITPTPELLPGAEPTVKAAPLEKTVDNGALKSEIDSLISSDRLDAAIVRLRDAVDDAPLDLERRRMLIDALSRQDPVAGAEEAERASVLMPSQAGLRTLAIRAWLRAGRLEEARRAANEAAARDPSGETTRLLRTELALREGKPGPALEAVGKAEDADSRFMRALARAMLGGADGVTADLDAVRSASSTLIAQEDRYELAATVLARAFGRTADDLRGLQQRSAVDPKAPGIGDDLDRIDREVAARAAFWNGVQVPSQFRRGHDLRLLANRLLHQSAVDLRAFLASGSDDDLTESRINLGEAMKQARNSQLPPKTPAVA